MQDKLFTRPFTELLVVQASFGYAFSTFSLLPKWLDTVLGLDSQTIGAVMGVFGISAVVFVPLVGLAVDRRGRRPFMLAGAVVIGLCSLCFLRVEEVGPLLYFLRLAQGLGFAGFFVAGLTIAADLSPPARISQAVGVFGVTNLVMNAIAPASTEWIAARFGWGLAFGVSAALAFVAALLTLRLAIPPLSHGEVERSSLLRLATGPEVLRPSVAIGLTAVTFSALAVFHQPYALANGIESVSRFFIAYACGAAIARVGFGDLADRKGRLAVARVAGIPYALAPLALIGVDPFRLVLAGGVLGLSHGFLYPALHAMVIAAVAHRERGAVTGIFLGAFNLGFALGPPVLGFVSERAGYPVTFAASSGFAVAALAVLVWPARQRTLRVAPAGAANASESAAPARARAGPATRSPS